MITELKTTKTITRKPEGILIYSKSGLGKTTFLAEAILNSKNGILFQCGEDGLSDITDKRITSVNKYHEVLGMGTTQDELINGWNFFKDGILKFLMLNKDIPDVVAFDGFDNLIINNLDNKILKEDYKNNKEKANGWGGAKCVEMDEELAMIIKAFEYIQNRGTSIYISCHSQIVTMHDPNQPDYGHWTINLPDRKDVNLRNRLINWSSATLFGTREVELDGRKIINDQKVLKTKEAAGYDAKCRYSIPETIPFEYKVFIDEVKKARDK